MSHVKLNMVSWFHASCIPSKHFSGEVTWVSGIVTNHTLRYMHVTVIRNYVQDNGSLVASLMRNGSWLVQLHLNVKRIAVITCSCHESTMVEIVIPSSENASSDWKKSRKTGTLAEIICNYVRWFVIALILLSQQLVICFSKTGATWSVLTSTVGKRWRLQGKPYFLQYMATTLCILDLRVSKLFCSLF